MVALIALVVLSSNFNKEIQSLQLEIVNLKETLNQTGDNSNQESQTLKLEIENLKQALNQTEGIR